MDGKVEVNDQHRIKKKFSNAGEKAKALIYETEAKRLIEVYLGKSIESLINDHDFRLVEIHFKKAKENALLCCDDKINDLTGYDEKLSIWKHSMCDITQSQYHKRFITEEIQKLESVKQAIKDHEGI